MATLQIDITQARSNISHYLFGKRDYSLMTADQQSDTDAAIRSGQRLFYYPPLEEGEKEPYEWSFLLRHQYLVVDASYVVVPPATQQIVTLGPDNFSGTIHKASIRPATGQSTKFVELQVVDEARIEQISASDGNTTGRPQYVAAIKLRHKSPGPGLEYTDDGQIYRLRFYPNPEQTYDAYISYPIDPVAWDDDNPVPIGGVKHAETLLQACRAAAELQMNDEHGIEYQRFLEKLKFSKGIDARERRELQLQSWTRAAEPTTIDLTFTDMVREAGEMLGYGSDPALYNHEQLSRAEKWAQYAYLGFLTQAVTQASQGRTHTWSFLVVEGPILSLANNDNSADLPENFTGDLHDLYVFPGGAAHRASQIQLVSVERLRALEGQYTLVDMPKGAPQYAALTPYGTAESAPQKWYLSFFPWSDGSYQIGARWKIKPARLALGDFPLGGSEHAETLLQAVRKVVEQRAMNVENGKEAVLYQERLEASVLADLKRQNSADTTLWPNDLLADNDETDPSLSASPGSNMLVLMRDTGLSIGLSAHPGTWSRTERGMVKRYVHEGCRWLWYPHLISTLSRRVHKWSFLRKQAMLELSPDFGDGTIEVTNASTTVTLTGGTWPDWAASGMIRVAGVDYLVASRTNDTVIELETAWPGESGSGVGYRLIRRYPVPVDLQEVTSEMVIRENVLPTNARVIRRGPRFDVLLRTGNRDLTIGPPKQYAVINRVLDQSATVTAGVSQTTQTRLGEFAFWPPPDRTYQVEFAYDIDPFPLTGDTAVPFGSPIYATAIHSACLAVAELRHHRVDDGPMMRRFERDLEAAISHDMNAAQPGYFGSVVPEEQDMYNFWESVSGRCNIPVSYEGQLL